MTPFHIRRRVSSLLAQGLLWLINLYMSNKPLILQLLVLCDVDDPYRIEQCLRNNPPDLPEITDVELAKLLKVKVEEAALIRKILSTSESDRERLVQAINKGQFLPSVATQLVRSALPGMLVRDLCYMAVAIQETM